MVTMRRIILCALPLLPSLPALILPIIYPSRVAVLPLPILALTTSISTLLLFTIRTHRVLTAPPWMASIFSLLSMQCIGVVVYTLTLSILYYPSTPLIPYIYTILYTAYWIGYIQWQMIVIIRLNGGDRGLGERIEGEYARERREGNGWGYIGNYLCAVIVEGREGGVGENTWRMIAMDVGWDIACRWSVWMRDTYPYYHCPLCDGALKVGRYVVPFIGDRQPMHLYCYSKQMYTGVGILAYLRFIAKTDRMYTKDTDTFRRYMLHSQPEIPALPSVKSCKARYLSHRISLLAKTNSNYNKQLYRDNSSEF